MRTARTATTADAAVRDLVRALSEFTMREAGVPSARAVHAALVGSVDSARYWQEPDGVDVLAAQHRVRNALVPIADQVMQSEPARSWTAGRGVEQWVIDWRFPDATIWLTDSIREWEGPRQSWRWSEAVGAWTPES